MSQNNELITKRNFLPIKTINKTEIESANFLFLYLLPVAHFCQPEDLFYFHFKLVFKVLGFSQYDTIMDRKPRCQNDILHLHHSYFSYPLFTITTKTNTLMNSFLRFNSPRPPTKCNGIATNFNQPTSHQLNSK